MLIFEYFDIISMNLITKGKIISMNEKLEKIKTISLVVIAISLGWIAFRFIDLIDILLIIANKN